MSTRTEVIRQAAAVGTADDGRAAEGGSSKEAARAAEAAPPRVSVDPMRSTDRYRLSLPGDGDVTN